MVRLLIKKGEETQFLFETTVTKSVNEVTTKIAQIYNDRLRIERLCSGKLVWGCAVRFVCCTDVDRASPVRRSSFAASCRILLISLALLCEPVIKISSLIIYLFLSRLVTEIEQLVDHGIMKPPEMHGLTDEQIFELKLRDEWVDKSYPSGGSISNPDPIGRRTVWYVQEVETDIMRCDIWRGNLSPNLRAMTPSELTLPIPQLEQLPLRSLRKFSRGQ